MIIFDRKMLMPFELANIKNQKIEKHMIWFVCCDNAVSVADLSNPQENLFNCEYPHSNTITMEYELLDIPMHTKWANLVTASSNLFHCLFRLVLVAAPRTPDTSVADIVCCGYFLIILFACIASTQLYRNYLVMNFENFIS